MKDQIQENDFRIVPKKEWGCGLLKQNYMLEKQIGHGAYGSVFEATDINSGKKIAIKKMENFQEKQDKQGRSFGFPITTLRQIKLLQKMNHPNILNINDVAYERGQKYKPPIIYLCLDLMDTDLHYLVVEKDYEFTPYRLQFILKQILEGLAYIHNLNIAHRDLKPSNILINSEGVVRIGDFGLAKKLSKISTARVVTMWYRAPQLLLGIRSYNTNIDVWSLGCIIAEFLIGKPLFYESKNQIEITFNIYKKVGTPDQNDWVEAEKQQFFIETKPSFSQDSQIIYFLKQNSEKEQEDLLLDLVEKMLRLNPHSRYSAADCLAHPFFEAKYEQEQIVPKQLLEKKEKINEGQDYVQKKFKHN